jgi:hypothetical protein
MAADPDDPAAVAAAIRTMRADPARLLEMGRRAKESARGYARVDELKRFVGIMEDAVQEKNGTAPSGIVSELSRS